VDQLFSILCRVLKCEISSPDALIKTIQQAPIIPKPEVRELLYIWDWRSFITPKLSDKALHNHSFYHSFQMRSHNKVVVFRGKKYSQDIEWSPEEGIKLLKDGFECSPVPASEFRLESLNLERVYSDLYNKFFPTLEKQERKKAEASWEKLRTVLENLPKKQKNLPTLRLSSLPKQNPELQPLVPDHLEQFMREDIPDLVGEHCNVETSFGKFQMDIQPTMDVSVYTCSVKERPWLGRVLNVQEDGINFEVQWFKKKGRSLQYQALYNKDGTRYTSVLLLETVMFWEFSDNKTDETFEISKEWYRKIMEEYSSHDLCYQ
jgi:hypothetical protein